MVVVEGDTLLGHETATEAISAFSALLDEIDLGVSLRRRAALVGALELPVPGSLHFHQQRIQQPLQDLWTSHVHEATNVGVLAQALECRLDVDLNDEQVVLPFFVARPGDETREANGVRGWPLKDHGQRLPHEGVDVPFLVSAFEFKLRTAVGRNPVDDLSAADAPNRP